MKAANDNKPKQTKLPVWLVWEGRQFPSDEAGSYIANDFKVELDPDGDIWTFHTLKGRPIHAALIPDEVEYVIDWDTGETESDDYVLSWHAEWFDTVDDARKALEHGLANVDRRPDDDNGTWGIEDTIHGRAA